MSTVETLYKILSTSSGSAPLRCRNELTGKISGIKSTEIENFYKNYCDSYITIDDDTKFSFSEEVGGDKTIPLIFEFKFKLEDVKDGESIVSSERTPTNVDDDDNFYKCTFEPKIIKLAQEVIKENFKISRGKQELICCIIRTESAWKEKNNLYKYIRLQFPLCVSYQDFIYGKLRNKFLKKLRKSDLHGEFPRQLKGEWKDFLMNISPPEFYTMFGSNQAKKSTKIDTYNFYGEIKDIEDADSIINNKIYEDPSSFFDIDKHSKIVKYGERNFETREGEDYIDSYLPIILSIHFYDKPTETQENDKESLKKEEEDDVKSVATDDSDLESVKKTKKNSITRCREMIEMISNERMGKVDFLRELGKVLYNETFGSEKGLREWNSIISENCLESGKRLTAEYWKYENQPYTWKTLAWYARYDSPEDFKVWQDNWARETMKVIVESKKITDVDVAELFYKFNLFEFMFCNKVWYQYSEIENRIIKLKGKEAVLERMTKLSDFLGDYGRSLNKNIIEATDYFKASRDAAGISGKLIDLVDMLKSTTFRSKLVTEAGVKFNRPDLDKHMDNNYSLLCCRNNIIELTDTGALIRKGKPEDFISKTTGVKYRDESTKDIEKYLKEVFPEKEVYEFMKRDISSYLFGKNNEKKFRSWIGETNGSKSIFQKIIRKMLGDEHCVVIPIEAFKKKGNGGPSPELAQLKNARIGFVNEPDNTDTMSAGFIKLLSSGGDIIFARGCGQDGGAIEMNLKVVAVMNSVPNINGADAAFFNRFMATPFESQWFDEADDEFKLIPKTLEEQLQKKMFVKDIDYDRKVDALASQLLTLAVKNYSNYKANKLNMPEYVTTFMKGFWEKNDPIIEFIEDCFEKSENEKDIIKKRKIFKIYQEWIKSTKPNHRNSMMDEKQLMKTLRGKRYFGKPTVIDDKIKSEAWAYYKVRELEDSDEDEGYD